MRMMVYALDYKKFYSDKYALGENMPQHILEKLDGEVGSYNKKLSEQDLQRVQSLDIPEPCIHQKKIFQLFVNRGKGFKKEKACASCNIKIYCAMERVSK